MAKNDGSPIATDQTSSVDFALLLGTIQAQMQASAHINASAGSDGITVVTWIVPKSFFCNQGHWQTCLCRASRFTVFCHALGLHVVGRGMGRLLSMPTSLLPRPANPHGGLPTVLWWGPPPIYRRGRNQDPPFCRRPRCHCCAESIYLTAAESSPGQDRFLPFVTAPWWDVWQVLHILAWTVSCMWFFWWFCLSDL